MGTDYGLLITAAEMQHSFNNAAEMSHRNTPGGGVYLGVIFSEPQCSEGQHQMRI